QGWLLIAKQRALRDQMPTGIRIHAGRLYPISAPGAATTTWAHDLQYIQQPEDFYGGPGTTIKVLASTGLAIADGGVDFFGGYGPGLAQRDLWPVRPDLSTLQQDGDYLQVKGGLVHRITGIAGSPNPIIGNFLSLAS